jgi:membrane fusion protein (multidrug efflux system)
MKHAFLSILLCGLIVGAGLGVTAVASKFRGRPSEASAATAHNSVRVTSVNVQLLKPTTVDDRLVLTGSVDPWEDIMLSAETRGKIEWEGVKEGDAVRKRQELIRIDTSLIRAQLDQAEAHERLAIQEFERAQKLSSKGIATDQALDKTKADHDVASASVRLIRTQLEKSVVYAPIDGVVDKLLKDENEFVDVGAALVRVVDIRKVKVRAGIPERDVPFFSKGNRVTLALDALAGRDFQGTIYRIGTTADPATLTFSSEIEVDNPDGLIKPGMIARVTLVRKTLPDSIAIPIFAVLSVENQRHVLVEDQGVARVRAIETGIVQGNSVQVTRGLAAGDRLIVVGQRDLKDGDAVKVLEVLE